MVIALSSLGTKLYTTVSVVLLTSWTLTVLGFTALNVLNSNRSYIESIASISLLTFLLSRLLVLSQPVSTPQDATTHKAEAEAEIASDNTIAHTLTTAHKRSRKEALIFLTFTCTWLYELISKAFLLFFMTVFGGVVAAIIYNDPNGEGWSTTDNTTGADSQHDDPAAVTALAEIDEFKTRTGVDFDPSAIFRWIPPRALVYFAVLVWVNFGTLGVYVLRYAWRALRKAAGSGPVVVVHADSK